MPSPREEPHWSATPVEVDAEDLMRSLLEEIEAGEAAQREQRQKDSPSTAGDESQLSTDCASEAKTARMSGSCLCFAEFGPDTGVGLLTQHSARYLAVADFLRPARLCRVHVPATSQTLVEVLLIDTCERADALTVGWGEGLFHASILAIR